MLGSNVRLRISDAPFVAIDGGKPLMNIESFDASDEAQVIDITGINHTFTEEVIGDFTTYTLSMEGTYNRLDEGQNILKKAHKNKSIVYIMVQYDVNEPEATIYKVQIKKFGRKVSVKEKISLSVEFVMRAVPEDKTFGV